MNTSLLCCTLLVIIQFFVPKISDIKIWEEHSEKIAVSDILGIWWPLDTLQNQIEFVNIESVHVEMRGIKHGVNYYIFQMTGDSIRTRGMAINWPPYDCEMRLVDPTTLDIHFFQYNDSTGIIMRYLR